MKTLSERQYTDRDFESVFALYRSTMRSVIECNFGWDESFQAENMRTTLLKNDTRLYLRSNSLVAFVSLRHEENLTNIFLVCVDVDCQRQGVGKEIITQIVDEARSKGTAVIGKILAGNDVAVFYKKLGFYLQKAEDGHTGVLLSSRPQAAGDKPVERSE